VAVVVATILVESNLITSDELKLPTGATINVVAGREAPCIVASLGADRVQIIPQVAVPVLYAVAVGLTTVVRNAVPSVSLLFTTQEVAALIKCAKYCAEYVGQLDIILAALGCTPENTVQYSLLRVPVPPICAFQSPEYNVKLTNCQPYFTAILSSDKDY